MRASADYPEPMATLRSARANPTWLAVVLSSFLLVCGGTAPAQEASDAPLDGELSLSDDNGGGNAASLPPLKTADWLSGYFEIGMDADFARRDSDIDLYQNLRLRVDPPKLERVRFDAAFWLNEELGPSGSRGNVLRDINDSTDAAIRLRVPHLYMEVDDLWGDSTLRVGRQRIREGVAYSRIDGLYFKQSWARWDWYVFGGARASLYEDDFFDDPVYGGGVSYRPRRGTRIAFDTHHAEERHYRHTPLVRGRIPHLVETLRGRDFTRRESRLAVDRLYTFSFWQDLGDLHRLFGRYTVRDGRSDELIVDLTGSGLPWGISYQLTYRGRFQEVKNAVTDLAFFYRVQGTYERYDNILAAVHKAITERLSLSLESEFMESGGNSAYAGPRDFQRYAAVLAMKDARPGLDFSVGLHRWVVQGGESLWSVNGEVKKAWKQFEVVAGLDFQRYQDVLVRYDPNDFVFYRGLFYSPSDPFGRRAGVPLTDQWAAKTRENVYGVYSRFRWDIDERQALRTSLRYEEDDGRQSPYWRLQTEYSIRF